MCKNKTTQLGGLFLASSLALMQILLDSGPPLYRLSVAKEVGSEGSAACGR